MKNIKMAQKEKSEQWVKPMRKKEKIAPDMEFKTAKCGLDRQVKKHPVTFPVLGNLRRLVPTRLLFTLSLWPNN